MLRNDQGVDYPGTRQTITPWLRRALETNQPYNRMVAALLNPLLRTILRDFWSG